MKKNFAILFFSVMILSVPVLFAGDKAIDQGTVESVKSALLEKYGDSQKFRIDRGVDQVAALWKEEDGCTTAFTDFCVQYFIGTPEALDANLKRLETNFEVLSGHFLKMMQDLMRPVQLELGEILPIDTIFAQYSPWAHLDEDFFTNKIAFIIRLNFPEYSLEEKTELGPKWSRKEWAHARAGGWFSSRVPADVIQKYSQFSAEAESYIANYNIFMGKLVDKDKKTYFPEDMKLITHWNLRDELKSQYADPKGLFKQKMIYEVMLHIVNQTIPETVINSSEYEWDPFANKIFSNGEEASFTPEPDTRYTRWLNIFKGVHAMDPYYSQLPTFIKRKFEAEREIPEADVEILFSEFCKSPQVKKVAKLIEKRLGRELKPWDIWYNGFKAGSSIPEEKLDRIVAERYPTVEAFQNNIEDILKKLGFSEEKARFLADRIQVDPSRGAGHAWGAEMKSEKALLRTRIPEDGMNYKGFSIALHELGHCVEQTFTLHGVDYYMLHGIPNAAFTEAFAYVLQDMDFDVLGIKIDDENQEHLVALENFWNSYEIMGVSLVDMKAWNWLYDHPEATPDQLKEAVIAIAKDVWNTYFADVFGVKDTPLLAIYSHMVYTPLYLPDYAIGHLIYFQIGRYLEGKNLGEEMERMCVAGNIVPQLWMINAVGSEISAKALLDAVDIALKHIK